MAVWLQEKDAIAEVFYEFPKRFARKFKGKGHEVRPPKPDNMRLAAPAPQHGPLQSCMPAFIGLSCGC